MNNRCLLLYFKIGQIFLILIVSCGKIIYLFKNIFHFDYANKSGGAEWQKFASRIYPFTMRMIKEPFWKISPPNFLRENSSAFSDSPSIISGFINSLSGTFVMLVYAEMYGAEYGMGYYVRQNAALGLYDRTWAGFIFMIIVLVIVMQCFEKIRNRILHWTM